MTEQKKRIIRTFSTMILILSMVVPMCISASARASDYLSSYSGAVSKSGSTVYVSFTVCGTRPMDDIGALRIEVYKEDGTWVKTFLHDTTSGMLGHNTGFKAGTVSFTGDANTTYKAYIGVYAGKGGSGDNRYFWAYE